MDSELRATTLPVSREVLCVDLCMMIAEMTEWMDVEVDDGLLVRLVASEAGLREIRFHPDPLDPPGRPPDNPVIREASRQLRAYFRRELRRFDLPLDLVGTDFQKRVWWKLDTIPYGEVTTYAAVAQAIGAPKAVRAVGAANGSNPLPLVLPCHRVIGSNRRLVG